MLFQFVSFPLPARMTRTNSTLNCHCVDILDWVIIVISHLIVHIVVYTGTCAAHTKISLFIRCKIQRNNLRITLLDIFCITAYDHGLHGLYVVYAYKRASCVGTYVYLHSERASERSSTTSSPPPLSSHLEWIKSHPCSSSSIDSWLVVAESTRFIRFAMHA